MDKWKLRYNIKQVRVCEESGDVHGETIDSWKERLHEILHDCTNEDVWNMDETGVFWQALPDRGFGSNRRQRKGGKKRKAWMTGEIMEAVLVKLNHRLSSSGCSIILLIDNTGCHLDDLRSRKVL